jgi:hypothetical protein
MDGRNLSQYGVQDSLHLYRQTSFCRPFLAAAMTIEALRTENPEEDP